MVRKSSLALVIAASLAPLSAHALGLGDIHLKSALNQELKADIDLLSVKSGELDTVKVELADPDAFDKAGLDRPYLLTQLRFRPVRRPDGSAVVEITSRGPIREPFLNFLVEVNWPNGRLRREYTVLLDPPATLDRRPPAVAAPAADTRPAGRPAGAGAPGARTAMPGEYGPTRANDTLWEIAAAVRPGGVGIEQMMIALQRANPDAFYRDNINYLKQGQILRVPGREEIQALSGSEARAAFLEQTARWEADRIGREAPSEAVVEPPADQVAEAPAPAAEPAQTSAGELRIAAAPSGGTPAGAGEGGDAEANVEALQNELILAREANESMRQESVDLQSRVGDLESQLADMERLLTLKDDQLAQLQATLGAEPEQPPADTPETAAPEEGESAMAQTEGAETAEGTETAAAEPGADTGGDTAMMSGETMPGGQMASGEGPGAAMESPGGMQEEPAAGSPQPGLLGTEAQDEGAMTAAGETGPEAAPPMPEPEAEPEAAAAQPEPDSSPVREASGAPWSNPVFWGVGGLAVLLLGGLGVAASRRRKEAAEVGDESILVDNTEPSAQRSEGFATSGESDSQTDETSFLSDFSPSDIDALQDETGEVDPVSEADVYMAYNRYQQAEELLRQAVRREPERTELRFKLLDVLFAAQAAEAFVNEAEDLAGAGAPQEHPDEWRRVVSMGQDLAPEHPLFVDEQPSIGEETAMVGEQGEGNDLGDLDIGDIESELEAVSGQSGWSDEDRERPGEAAVAAAATAGTASEAEDEDWGVSDLEIESSSDFIAESEPALGEEPREESDFDFSELGDLDTRISGEAAEEGPYGAGRQEDSSLSVDEAIGEVDIGGDLEGDGSKDALGAGSPNMEVDRMESIPDEDSVQIGGLDSALSELEASEDLALEESDTGAAPEQEPDLELPEMGEEDEVATKLDLARAYMDMGDEEGARSILDEVMAEGSDIQQSEARGLMERLA